MTYLRSGEGNLIFVEVPYYFFDVESFTKKFTEKFGAWGRVERTDLQGEGREKILKLEIHDVDPDSPTHPLTEGWVEQFQTFSLEFNIGFVLAWVPYVNAFKDARIYEIEAGVVVGERALTWEDF